MSSLSPAVYVEAFHSADTPMLVFDLNFLVRDVNRAGQAFTGYTRDELVDEPVSVIAGNDDVVDEIVETLIRGEPWQGEFALQTKSGTRVYGRGSTAPIVVDGKTKGYVAIFVDTTKQRRYASTSRVLSRLLRHDLRNELNILYGYIDRAAASADDTEVLEALEQARAQVMQVVGRADRVRKLRDLLEQSYDAESDPVRLAEVLEERVKAVQKQFPDADISLGPVPGVRVYADDLLPAALDALLENAVVHNDKAVAEVEVDVIDRQTDVIIRICDNGPGVPYEQRDLIFGREDTDVVHHGTGIGLFLVDNIVDNYDGAVWVEENDPEGAVFAVRLQHASEAVIGQDAAGSCDDD
ncbi:PAS domain-containing sensor histidine kinase [Salinigranum rubrum]|uniref:histidine kinase n=1 Tax=Salinigranum rubrum TaxID=755307 RepID=A0A2I8VJ83_9EURY|nr:PAS domain-containing sensor histidine kinase [Salinigranum rubrum]AUV81986.1 PAS domain-containing sensor histidine kinase [Salinigranum rubrum]